MVLNEGSVVEFDSPHALLQSHNSVFAGLVEALGKTTADLIKKLAQNRHIQTEFTSI